MSDRIRSRRPRRAAAPADRTAWFARCGWGLFCHYLADTSLSADAWNAQVDHLDVDALVRQLDVVGVRYLFLTIGQNSGHFLGPNAAYDEAVGIHPSKCSRRDVVAELGAALAARGIPLLAYLPSGAPAADPIAVQRLGWEWGFEGGWPQAWGTRRTGKRLAEFQTRWEAVVREWSRRWGTAVRGWWIDGCYFADEMYRHPDAPNFASFAAALRAGNPEAIVAFNPGVTVPVVCHTEFVDFTAGEIAQALPECPGAWAERHGHRARYHILSYLGESWGRGQPRFPPELVAGYTQHVAQKGGVVSWDVPIGPSGIIPEAYLRQLEVIGRTVPACCPCGGRDGAAPVPQE